ncbi:hypothetical protein Hanom_Chr00s113257g01808501 [Helianthus anomalus]
MVLNTVEEVEVRILEPESSGGLWQTKGTIHIQTSEPALINTTTRENETLLAIRTAYVQGEDVAARGRVLLFSVENSTENSPAKAKCSLWWLNGDSNKAVSGWGFLLLLLKPPLVPGLGGKSKELG